MEPSYALLGYDYRRAEQWRPCHHSLLLHAAPTVEVLDTPENRGMINKISYLLKVESSLPKPTTMSIAVAMTKEQNPTKEQLDFMSQFVA